MNPHTLSLGSLHHPPGIVRIGKTLFALVTRPRVVDVLGILRLPHQTSINNVNIPNAARW
jgi:hypothetical protein